MTINPEYEKKYESIVKEKLLSLCSKKKCRVFLFGSRAEGRATRSSDFDIGITGLPEKDFNRIESQFQESLEESIVPYSVDLINFDRVEQEFKKTALKKTIIWKTD